MTRLQWGQTGSRSYESGIDRGVLYFPLGGAVPWNGLTSIDEETPTNATPLYFDGVKYFDSVLDEDFEGTIKAYTYPDELLQFEGHSSLNYGLFTDGQPAKEFHMSYRTQIGNDLGEVVGHKIHILFNLTAQAEDPSFETISDQVSPMEFGWKIMANPEIPPGYAPTAHAIIDTTKINRFILRDLEKTLYGDDTVNPSLPSLYELTQRVQNFEVISVVDNGDGTATITGPDELVYPTADPTIWTLDEINLVNVDANTKTISSTNA